MANADQIYADPSALLKLYINEPESRAMALWRNKIRGPLAVSHHGRVELTNGIGLAVFRGFIAVDTGRAALAALDEDFDQGRYVQADVPWRSTFRRAGEISRAFTPLLGSRSLDILHVASALMLDSTHFVTFDVRQGKLAKAAGLKLIKPS